MAEANPVPQTPDIDRKVFDRVVVESTNAKIGLNPEGGYITSWKVKNPKTGIFEDILYQGSVLKRTGIPTLFPNYGEGYVTHGFWRTTACEIATDSPSRAVMRLDESMISPKMRDIYPYLFNTEVTVEALENGSMLYSMSVRNKGNQAMPITPGIHPYWAVPHQDKRKITTESIPGFDAATIDWDNNPPDTVYDSRGKAVIKLPIRQIVIEDITPNGPVVKHIVAWSETPQESDYDFVCFEPITGGDNAIRNNPILIPANGEWKMQLRFSTQSADQ